MKLKFVSLTIVALFLAGCESTVPSTTIDKNGKFPPPGPVAMKYLGHAKADDANDPINGCRVYVFKIEDYIQTAILCNGQVTTASAHHQAKKKKDDSSANNISDLLDGILDADDN